MNKIVRIRLAEHGKVQEFDSGNFVLNKGQKVLVETEQGLALGIVCNAPRSLEEDVPVRPTNKVYRLASQKDIGKFERKGQVEKDVYAFCGEKIKERSLPMSLVSVDRQYDGSKIIVYFTADQRVDFRELVRDLVQKYRTRVEMRQIGARHQAKMFGGLGVCGRQLCCSSFLNSFAPVSIKMAKTQNLSLNPAKISGMCGRLMCCLTYEREFYEKATKNMPKNGKAVSTARGKGKVVRQNVLRETLTVALESGEEMEIFQQEVLENSNHDGQSSNDNEKSNKKGSNNKKNNKQTNNGKNRSRKKNNKQKNTNQRNNSQNTNKERSIKERKKQ
jgi:cell fate regulator YaaT (PSP1 superfamily)